MLAISVSCVILIIAQSAATSRSFAMKHGDKVDINRDIVGLFGANLAAGLTGTFVVNGSPTKTEILDEQHGRSQVANLTMALMALLFTMFFTASLANMPKAVLAGIVFLIGVGLIDVLGLTHDQRKRAERVRDRAAHRRRGLRGRRRAGHHPGDRASRSSTSSAGSTAPDFVVGESARGRAALQRGRSRARRASRGSSCSATTPSCSTPTPTGSSTTSRQSSRRRPTRCVGWSSTRRPIDDVDYSAWNAIKGLGDYLHAKDMHFGLARVDPQLRQSLDAYGFDKHFDEAMVFGTLEDAISAFRGSRTS